MADDKSTTVIRTSSVFPSGSIYGGLGGTRPQVPDDVRAGREARDRVIGQYQDRTYTSSEERAQAERHEKNEEAKAKERERAAQVRARNQRLAGLAREVYVNGRLETWYTVFGDDGEPLEIRVLGGFRQDGQPATSAIVDPRTGVMVSGRMDAQTDEPVGLSPGQVREQQNKMSEWSATFGILGMGADLGSGNSNEFIMSYGERLDRDGQVYVPGGYTHGGSFITDRDGTRQDGGNRDVMSGSRRAEYNATGHLPGEQRGNPDVTNYMTLAGGVSWFSKLARQDPEAYNEALDLMVKAGYLDAADVRKGIYTIEQGRAAAKAMVEASENNRNGGDEDFLTFLRKLSGAAEETDAAARGRDYQPIRRDMEDPAYLAATARAAAEQMLGRSLSDDEASRFTSHFHGMQTTMYNKIDAAGRAGEGATVTVPNAGGQAESFLRDSQYDDERARQLTGGYMDAFMGLMGLS